MNSGPVAVLLRSPGLRSLAAALCLWSWPALSAADSVTIPAEALPVATYIPQLASPGTRVQVSGVSVYRPEELLAFAIGHDMATNGTPSLAGTVDAIEQIYREDGYLLTEARAEAEPTQQQVSVTVHEGHVVRIDVQGLSSPVSSRISACFEGLVGQVPLHARDFERALMLASDLAGIELRSEFAFEGPDDGAVLRLFGSQRSQAGAATVDNVPLPGTDAVRGYVVQEAYSLATPGDLLRILAVGTRETNDSYSLAGTLFYRRPVGANGWYVEGFAGNAFSRRNYTDVAGSSDQTGVDAALATGRALQRDLHGYTYLIGEYEYQESESRLAIGRMPSTSHAARLYLVSSRMASDGGQAMGSIVISVGGRPDRDSSQPMDGERRFAHLRGSVGLIEPLAGRWFLRLEATGQWTGDDLPSVEKFAVGHWPYLRGFAPAEGLGDRGLSGTVEMSHVVDVMKGHVRSIAPYAFLDFGRVDDSRSVPGESSGHTFASAGIGATASLDRRLSLTGWLAIPLRDGVLTAAGDVALSFSLTKGW